MIGSVITNIYNKTLIGSFIGSISPIKFAKTEQQYFTKFFMIKLIPCILSIDARDCKMLHLLKKRLNILFWVSLCEMEIRLLHDFHCVGKE